MILSIFLLFFGTGLLFMIISSFLEVNDTTLIFRMAGSLIILILGLTLMTTGIDYVDGENETYVYGSNLTGYHWDYDYDLTPNEVPAYELLHIKKYDVYDNYTNHTFGLFFAILGAFGFALTFIEIKHYRREE